MLLKCAVSDNNASDVTGDVPMDIYFGFTVAGDRSGLEAAKVAVSSLEKMGHRVLTRHLLEDGAGVKDRALGAEAVYRRDMAWLDQCDILIAEASGSSFGLGFEAGYLLGTTTKPVILFYRRDLKDRLSLLITGNSHPRCLRVPYDDPDEIGAILIHELAGSLPA